MEPLFGWIASFCFFVCGAPQAYKSIKEKHSFGMSGLTLGFYFIGEISLLVATYLRPDENLPLVVSTSFNIFCLSIVLWFKFFPQRKYQEVADLSHYLEASRAKVSY